MNMPSFFRRVPLLAAAGLLFATGERSMSEPLQPATATAKPAMERLIELRETNAELLKRQKATQEQLDALIKEAEQLRIFTKRS